MVSIVVRKSPSGLLRYFEDNFGSPMWTDEQGMEVARPRLGGWGSRKAALCPWRELSLMTFRGLVREVDIARKANGILALELGFSGPKSVSIAALADERISLDLIMAHCAAVDDALRLISPLLVARAGGQLVGCGVRLIEFLHPWNRVLEPHLHSHLIALRDFGYSHALWTTPVFMVQRTLREIYSYSLCSRLVRRGLQVVVNQAGDLAWELAGVPADLQRKFSRRSQDLQRLVQETPRGYFSQGAEYRMACWRSRRQLPKTDASVSIASARRQWRREMSPLSLVGSSPRVDLGPLALHHVFRLSAVVTRQQFIGAHLRWWLGSGTALHEAVLLADKILDSHVAKGEVLRSGDAYCCPQLLQTEGDILREISESFGSGPRLRATSGSLGKKGRDLLAADTALKIVSTDGSLALAPSQLKDEKGGPFGGSVECLRSWDSSQILRVIRATERKPLVLFVEEPILVGDFGVRVFRVQQSGARLSFRVDVPFRLGRRRVVVRQGDLMHQAAPATNPGILTLAKQWMRAVFQALGESGSPSGVVLAPKLDDDQLQRLNWQRLREQSSGYPVQLCRIVPWERLLCERWEAGGIFASRTAVLPVPKKAPGLLRTVRHRAIWFCSGPIVENHVPVVGRRGGKRISLEALRSFIRGGGRGLHLFERVPAMLQPGTPLVCPVGFESKGQTFPAGQIFTVERVDTEGVVHFRGNSFWPLPHLVLEPAYFVRQFRPGQRELSMVFVQAEEGMGKMESIVNLPPTELVTLVSREPRRLLEKLERESEQRSIGRRLTMIQEIHRDTLHMDLEPLFPLLSVWQDLQNGLTEVFPVLKTETGGPAPRVEPVERALDDPGIPLSRAPVAKEKLQEPVCSADEPHVPVISPPPMTPKKKQALSRLPKRSTRRDHLPEEPN